MPGGWYGALLRNRSAKEEWLALQDHFYLLKLVNADVFIFADVSGSIQGDQSQALSKRPKLEKDEWKKIVFSLAQKPFWIMDGNFSASFHIRIPRADTIVYCENTSGSAGKCLITTEWAEGQYISEEIFKE